MKAKVVLLLVASSLSMTSLLLSSDAIAAPAASIVPGRSAPQTSVEPTSLVVEASLNNVHDAAEQLERGIKALYHEMNRHEEAESWSGIFEGTGPQYGNYSTDAMMPIGSGLESSFTQGPLLEPRDAVVNKVGADIAQFNGKVCDVLTSTKLPTGVPDTITARWQNLQGTTAALKTDCQKLTALLKDPDYDQQTVSKLLISYRDDAVGLKDQCKKIAQMLRHAK